MDSNLYYAHQIPTLLMLVYMRTSSFQHWLRLHTYTLPWFLTYFNEIFYVLGINKTYITAFLLNASVKQGAVRYDINKSRCLSALSEHRYRSAPLECSASISWNPSFFHKLYRQRTTEIIKSGTWDTTRVILAKSSESVISIGQVN